MRVSENFWVVGLDEPDASPQIHLFLMAGHLIEFMVVGELWMLAEDVVVVHFCLVNVLASMHEHPHLLLVEVKIFAFVEKV